MEPQRSRDGAGSRRSILMSCLWHLADSLSGLASRPLLGLEQPLPIKRCLFMSSRPRNAKQTSCRGHIDHVMLMSYGQYDHVDMSRCSNPAIEIFCPRDCPAS